MTTTHYSKKPGLFPMEGGCVCGLIRYSLAIAPFLVHCCSCTACQHQTGTLFCINALVEATAVRLLPSAAPRIPASASEPSMPAGFSPALARTTRGTPAAELRAKAAPQPDLICIPTESGVGQTVAQCPACRTTLWNHYADAGPHCSYIRVGTLDRGYEIEPDVHIYTRNRWASLRNFDYGVPAFEEYYPKRIDLIRPEARERFEALLPTVKAWQAEVYGKK